MKYVVIFFTHSGKTRVCAEAISKEVEADLREIKLKKNRKGFLLYFLGGFEALLGKKVELLDPNYDLSGYDAVILASPTWANRQAPAVFTFASNTDFSGKKVMLFTVSMNKPENVKNTLLPFIRKTGGEFVGKAGVCVLGKNDDQLKQEAIKMIKGINK